MRGIAQEKNFENKVKGFLKSRGCYFNKNWGGGQFTKAGIPDIFACCNGYFIGIEVKAQNGKPSDLQLYNVRKIKQAGGFAMVLYPSAYERFKEFILDLEHDTFTREMEDVWK